MSDFKSWVADCHLQSSKGESEYQCRAAIWTDKAQNFRIALDRHVADLGYKVLWVEECLSAPLYVARHGDQQIVGALSRVVHSGHSVELGPIKAVDDEGVPEPSESYLIIDAIEGLEPLDLQMGAYPIKTVPDALSGPLFGQPAPTEVEIEHYGNLEAVPPLKTYAILDVAKMPYLLTGLMETSGLQHQSLFQGQTQEDLKEHAPYLVELEDNNSFVTKLFTGPDGVNGLWEKELGIYVRSRAELEDLRKHFRKFTRVQDENGKWYLFRFWDQPYLAELFKSGTQENVEKILAVNTIILVDSDTLAGTCFVLNPNTFTSVARGGLKFFKSDLAALSTAAHIAYVKRTTRWLRKSYGNTRAFSGSYKIVEKSIHDAMNALNLSDANAIADFAAIGWLSEEKAQEIISEFDTHIAPSSKYLRDTHAAIYNEILGEDE